MRTAFVLSTSMAAVSLAPAALAAPWRARAEVAAELDSNVNHAETGDAVMPPSTAALVRTAGRLDGAGRVLGGDGWLRAGGDVRAQVEGDAAGEDVAVASAQAGWLRAVGDRPARAGLRVGAYDGFGLEGVGARTLRWLQVEGLVVLDDDGRRATLSLGAHDLVYKPDRELDWRGPSLGLDLSSQLWRGDDLADGADPSSLELGLRYRVDARTYAGAALAEACPPGTPAREGCVAVVDEPRSDLQHRAAAGVTYTGERVYAAEYELTVNDSSSLGQSLVRHRLIAAVTSGLPAGFLVTARVAAQLEQYLDGLLVPRGVDARSFTSIDEENRSSASLHLARPLGGGLTAEARWAFWTSGPGDVDFRRHLVTLGLVWAAAR